MINKYKLPVLNELGSNAASFARLYELALMIGVSLTPIISIWYLITFSPIPALRFEDHGFHEIVIAFATLVGLFISYVSWRSYQASGEIFLRWLTVGFLVFTIIYTPHGLFTRTAHHNVWLFLLYGPVSRLAMLGCFMYGLLQYGKPPEKVAEVTASGFWWRVLIVCAVTNVGVAVLAHSPIASSYWVRASMELGAIALALSGIGIMLLRRIDSPLMKFFAIALAIFAQAAIAFMLAKPWQHLWWLAHVIFAGGFFILSWGVTRALLTTRSFALAYSQEKLMRELEAQKIHVESINIQLLESIAKLRKNEIALLKFQDIIESTDDAIISKSLTGTIESWNKGAEKTFGYTAAEAIGQPIQMLIPPDCRQEETEILERVFHREHVNHNETIRLHKDGRLMNVYITISPILDENEKVIGASTIVRDISADKKNETEAAELREQLTQASKMESIGHLTAGIAHDFNNILGAMLGYTELSQQMLAAGKANTIDPYLTEIYKSGTRAKELILQMLTFSRLSQNTTVGEPPIAILSMIIKEVTGMSRSTIPSTIEINCSIETEGLGARILPVNLHQILLNLIVNARDSLGEYGRIDVTLSKRHYEHQRCSSCKMPISGGYAQIKVQDSGSGIPEHVLAKIFDPFFTTKGVGKGTGMGLSVVHGLVHAQQGHIIVQSSHETGTSFDILLPMESADAEP